LAIPTSNGHFGNIKRRKGKNSAKKKDFSYKQGKVEFIGTHNNVGKGMTIISFNIESQLAGPSYFNKLPGLGRILTSPGIK